MINILIISGLFMAVFAVAEVWRLKRNPPVEWTRKFTHIAGGSIAMSFPWVFESPASVAILSTSFISILWVSNRFGWLKSVHEVGRKSFGDLFFPLAIFILFFLSNQTPMIYCISLSALVVSDALAALVGKKYGRLHYQIFLSKKSLEGSIAFFASIFCMAYTLLFLFSPMDPLTRFLITFQMGVLVTLIEAVSTRGLDNLLVPIGTFLLAKLTFDAPFSQIALILGGVSIVLPILAIVFIRFTSIVLVGDRYLFMRGKEVIARLSTEVSSEHLGIIGHFEAQNQDAGVALLEHAKKVLQKAGAHTIVGPMDGSTWGRYRLELPREASDPVFDPPNFLGEPQNPPDYPQHFMIAGFVPSVQYESRWIPLHDQLDFASVVPKRVHEKYGPYVRSINLEDYENELKLLYGLIEASFSKTKYFEPIGPEAFVASYLGFKPNVDPDLVLLAFDPNDQLIGYALAYPDRDLVSNAVLDRVVLKTLTCVPEARGFGLSYYLSMRVHEISYKKGYKGVIHALMEETNKSEKMSLKYESKVFKRYALYECNS